MDAETVNNIVTLAQAGGNAVVIFAVWIAWKAGQSATKAVDAIHEIRNAVVASGPKLDAIAKSVADMDERTEEMDKRGERIEDALEELPAQLAKAVA